MRLFGGHFEGFTADASQAEFDPPRVGRERTPLITMRPIEGRNTVGIDSTGLRPGARFSGQKIRSQMDSVSESVGAAKSDSRTAVSSGPGFVCGVATWMSRRRDGQSLIFCAAEDGGRFGVLH